MTCKDALILDEITSSNTEKIINRLKEKCVTEASEYIKSEFPGIYKEIAQNEKITYDIEFALDNSVLSKLKTIKNGDLEDEFFLFKQEKSIGEIWITILEKSIKCLRFFDKREPFLKNPKKHPIAYGVDELSQYFSKYTDFEKMLYGGAKYYRDHVIHVFRVWMLGISTLLKDNASFLNKINISNDIDFNFNSLEKISIWSIIALTHDLGYPLEKSQEIIDNTRDMMTCFIKSPKLSMDLSFNGIQNNMNDFVLRFASSKMKPKKYPCLNEEADNIQYVARLQPKYYFKLQKSLEKYKHGTISAIIIYKMLLFFLESDFNINEDYTFDSEDARQFYIRREILRAIASHTCKDIYHLKMQTFSFLLIIIDDCQDWGRKNISELYVKNKNTYNFEYIKASFADENNYSCQIKDNMDFDQNSYEDIERILKNLYKQFRDYSSWFRDGQDTINRNFSVSKESIIKINESSPVTFTVEFCVANTEISTFKITVENPSDRYNENFLASLFMTELPSTNDENGKRNIESKYITDLGSGKLLYNFKLD